MALYSTGQEALPLSAMGLSIDDLRQAFREFDLDKNGYVGAAEIAHVLKSMGENVTDDEVDEMILMADMDGDGQVSFEEFAKLVLSLSAPPPPPPPHAAMGAGPGGAYVPGGRAPTGFDRMAGAGVPPHLAGLPSGVGSFYGHGAGGYPGGLPPPASALAPSGNPVQDMETFQRMNALDADALRRVFHKFQEVDRERTGMVDVNEFCRLLRVERSPFVERLFSMFDTDRGGLIDLKEFIVGLANVSGDVREDKVRFAFEVFDLDNSGFIEAHELRKIVRATNLASEKQLDRKVRWLLSQCDRNGDGQISFEEFKGLAKKFPNLMFPAFSLAGAVNTAGLRL